MNYSHLGRHWSRSLVLGVLAPVISLVLGYSAVHAATRVFSTNCANPCTTGTCYTSLASALSASNSGDVILVCPDTYYSQFNMSSIHKRLTIKAVGTVIVDGSDSYIGDWLWTRLNTTNVWYAQTSINNGTKDNQLFVDDTRYLYVAPPGTGFAALSAGTFSYDTVGTDTIYANIGGDNPGDYHNTFITTRQYCISALNSDSLTIDGFVTQRAFEKGIYVRGNGTDVDSLNIRAMTVKNCTAKENHKQGIHLRNCVDCVLDGNTAYTNCGHGIYLTVDSVCTVVGNTSYNNNDIYVAGIAGDVAGFKIGDNPTRDVRRVIVDYNVAHNNEDSGFNVKGGRGVAVRRNVSYSNGDHGFDTLLSDSTALLNNVSARNDHYGISCENNATHVECFNNILWHNGVTPNTLNAGSVKRVAELYLGDSLGTFVSNNNVVCGLAPDTVVSSDYKRYLVEFPRDTLYASWIFYRHNQPGHDAASYSTDPAFVDSSTANFKLNDVYADPVDAAKTDVATWGWLNPLWLSTEPARVCAP